MKDSVTPVEINEDWDVVVTAKGHPAGFFFRELLRYKDLLLLFVRRDLVTTYKQSILGPLWFVIQPVFTALAFTIIFGGIAGISTDGYPRLLFYLTGVTAWSYFSDCVARTSNTFIANAPIFSKVYFPRLIVPLSIVISSFAKYAVQLVLLVVLLIYYMNVDKNVHPNWHIVLLPLVIVIMAGLGLSFGMIISSLTTRYRDLQFLVGFGIQLLMYASPVVYPMSIVQNGKLALLIRLNPMTSVIETVRYAFLSGDHPFTLWPLILYSLLFMLVSMTIAVWVFNRAQRTFMDTV